MKCPHCGSSRTIKAGKLKNKYVTKQGYRCKDCRRYFVERDGFEGMTYLLVLLVGTVPPWLLRRRKRAGEFLNP